MRDRPILLFGDCEFDVGAWQLTRAGRPVKLEPKAVELLGFLVEHAGEVVSKNAILDAVWKDAAVTENAMARVIAQLRSALGDDAHQPRYVETVHTRGYRFIASVTRPLPVRVTPVANAAESTERERRYRRSLAVAAVAVVVGAAALALLSHLHRGKADVAGDSEAAIPSLAVLPFDNLGPVEQLMFADGMTEALTAQLARIQALKVITRRAVMGYRERPSTLREVGRELGVVSVVEGAVLLAGSRVRVTAHLVDCESSREMWAESYEGELSEVLALQARIARAIAREIRVRLTAEEELLFATQPTVGAAAYTEYLKGMASGEKFANVQERLESLLRDSIEHYRKTVALELDPTVVSAHLALARVLFTDGNWEGAEREFREAARLQPNSADWRYGVHLMYAGRFDEALARLRHAQERWPNSPWIPYDIGVLRLCAGQLDAARPQVTDLRERLKAEYLAALLEARLLSAQGRHGEAVEVLERHRRELTTNFATSFLQALSYAAAKAGQSERARQAIGELEALGGEAYLPALYALGDLAEVRQVLERRRALRSYGLRQARCWPEYEVLMGVPEIAEILREFVPPATR